MEYRFNAERDRLLSHSFNPAFFKASYIGQHTEREALLWSCTSNTRHQMTVAEKFAKNDEIVDTITLIPKSVFAKWLLGGKDSLEIYDQVIPADYCISFLITEDQPSSNPKLNKGKYGDLSEYREKLLSGDENLKNKLYRSFMASRPEADVVRIAPEPPMDHPGLASYKEEMAKKDAEEQAKRVASMERPNVSPQKEPDCGSMNCADSFDDFQNEHDER